MILYNMRYRGPYEYDKFILNVFQFHNEMLDIENGINESTETNLSALIEEMDESINSLQLMSEQYILINEMRNRR